MKTFYFVLLFNSLSVSAYSQAMALCDSIAMYNNLGGLDCALLSIAPYTADSYQWLNCDDSYAPFPDDTTDFLMNNYNGNVALEVTVGACIDTSYCQYHCMWGIDELYVQKKELIRIIDPIGRETDEKPNAVLIYIFNDGTTEKVYRVE